MIRGYPSQPQRLATSVARSMVHSNPSRSTLSPSLRLRTCASAIQQQTQRQTQTQTRCSFSSRRFVKPKQSITANSKNNTLRTNSTKTKKRSLSAGTCPSPSTATATTGTTADTNITNKAILPLIGNAAYIAIASGFLMTDMLSLRVLLMGGYTGIVAFHALHPRPLQIPLRWSAFFVLVNAGAVGLLLMDRYAAPLNDEEETLYQHHFEGFLTRGQFHQLLSLGQRQRFPIGSVLTIENEACPSLFFLESGSARVFHGASSESVAARIEQGGFVNDVAFQRGSNVGAYGTVVISSSLSSSSEEEEDHTVDDDNDKDVSAYSSLIVWDIDALRTHLKSRPEMDRNMKYCLSEHLVKSLLRQREASYLRQEQQQQQQ